MINENSVQKADSYLISQFKKHPDQPFNKPIIQQPRPFITISRETGSGGTSAGEELVDYLNNNDHTRGDIKWTLFDKNLIEKVIEDHRLPEVFKNYMTEEKISGIQDTFERLMGLHPGISVLASKTCNTIISLASMGNVVIVGRGANILTKNMKGGFHIRLIADIEWKIRRIESMMHLSRKDALKFIDEEDNRRREYVKKLFNKNVSDPGLYDMVIKSSAVSFKEIAQLAGTRVLNYTHYQLKMLEVY